MPAYVVCPTEEQWQVLLEILGEINEGGILVSPKSRELIREKRGFDPADIEDQPIDYDFGGDADIYLDIVYPTNSNSHMAVHAMEEHVADTTEDQAGQH